mmetsp:Transcript_98736/g.279775  ORF Transcript_98736/g.279775 Transcript_98736/m.279775 type:complete len:264 (+) Transcript_98736:90-881(+)
MKPSHVDLPPLLLPRHAPPFALRVLLPDLPVAAVRPVLLALLHLRGLPPCEVIGFAFAEHRVEHAAPAVGPHLAGGAPLAGGRQAPADLGGENKVRRELLAIIRLVETLRVEVPAQLDGLELLHDLRRHLALRQAEPLLKALLAALLRLLLAQVRVVDWSHRCAAHLPRLGRNRGRRGGGAASEVAKLEVASPGQRRHVEGGAATPCEVEHLLAHTQVQAELGELRVPRRPRHSVRGEAQCTDSLLCDRVYIKADVIAFLVVV